MAENPESRSREDLTEEASPFRLEEFRRKGMVAQSRELNGLIALLASAIMLYLYSSTMGSQITSFMRDVFIMDMSSHFNLGKSHFLSEQLTRAVKALFSIGFPVCVAGFFLGILGSFFQVGSIFSFDPIVPDLDKLNPIKGIQRFFSLRQLIDAIRLIVKAAAVTWVSYSLIKSEIFKSPFHILNEPGSLLSSYGQVGKVIFISMLAILAVFAGFDLWLQRWEYNKNLRLTKQEAKQEHKEREGDPQIKARIRSVQREMARKRMIQAVKKADVVITNPTHIAVAVIYDKEKMTAPKIVAKGADFIAQKIKQTAIEAGVPLVENVPLARTLYKSVKVGQYIPRILYQAVAEVLAYVYRLKNRKL